MAEPGQLNVNDRILLHLSRFATDVAPEEYPPETTQAGIATAVSISRTHVPRAVKGLSKDGLATELSARVRGHDRRMNVYSITPEGLRKADEIWRSVQDTPFSVRADRETLQMVGREIESRLGKKRAMAAVARIRDGFIEVSGRARAPVRALELSPGIGEFFGREGELQLMEDFMSSEAKTLVLLGNKGYGATSLARKFVEGQDESDVLWLTVSEATTAKDLEKALLGFGKKVRGTTDSVPDVMNLENALIVFDDFFVVGEDVVEFLASLVDSAGEAKMIITARQETPAYNWFYHKKNVDSGIVQELRVKGLDQESARRLLGNAKLSNEALKRLVTMTRGQPSALKMIRDEDEKGLKTNTALTPEEIKYLLILKNKTE